MTHVFALLGAWLASGVGLVPEGNERGAAAADPISVSASATGVGLSESTAGVISWQQQAPPIRIWVDEGLDLFYPGDPVRLRFRSEHDAYVAVVHLDPEGQLELLYPASPWDDAFVRGQRTYHLPGGLSTGRFILGRSAGIGFFYIIASPSPLDLRFFQARTGSWSDAWGLGRVVRGDPFWVFDYLTYLLAPDPRFARHTFDIFSYHLGGRHRYPAFACYDRLSARDPWGHYPYYPSCARLQRLLVTHPYYYDTRRFRGDRGIYLSQLQDLAPRHGFKEGTVAGGAPPLGIGEPRGQPERPLPRGTGVAAPPPLTQERGAREADPPRSTPARQRPTLERRSPPREVERREPTRAAPTREQPRATPPREQPRATPPRESPSREEARPQPRPQADDRPARPAERPSPRARAPDG